MPSRREPHRPDPTNAATVGLVISGICLITVGGTLHGLVRGLLQGAGIALVLVGVGLLSAYSRRRRDDDRATGDDAMWLPSRDRADDERQDPS